MREKVRTFFRFLTPEPRTLHGAAWGLICLTAILWLITGYDTIFEGVTHVGQVLTFLAITIAAPLAGLLVRLVLNLLRARDAFFSWTLAACFVMLMLVFMGGGAPQVAVGAAAVVALAASFIGGGIAAMSGSRRGLALGLATLGALVLIAWRRVSRDRRQASRRAAERVDWDGAATHSERSVAARTISCAENFVRQWQGPASRGVRGGRGDQDGVR